MVNGLLIGFVDQFQGLEILQQEIYSNYESEYQLVIKMVEHIEDPLLSCPWKTTKNLPQGQQIFFDAAKTLHAHNINRMMAQTKKVSETI